LEYYEAGLLSLRLASLANWNPPMGRIDLMSLSALAASMQGLTPALGSAYAEASAVCLEHNGHTQGVTLDVIGTHPASYTLSWAPVSLQMAKSHNDLQEATERGATCVAIHLARSLLGLSVVERSRKGTGFDFWLGTLANNALFQNTRRLEVSGILNGDNSEVRARVNEKRKQVSKSNGTPSCVIVVEFSRPISHITA
jgi:hypothetical protein